MIHSFVGFGLGYQYGGIGTSQSLFVNVWLILCHLGSFGVMWEISNIFGEFWTFNMEMLERQFRTRKSYKTTSGNRPIVILLSEPDNSKSAISL